MRKGLSGFSLVAMLVITVIVGGLIGVWWFPRTTTNTQIVYKMADEFQPVQGQEYVLNRFRLVEAVASVSSDNVTPAYLLELNVGDSYYDGIRCYPRVFHPVADVIIVDSQDNSTVVFYRSASGQKIALIKAQKREPIIGQPDRVWANFCSLTFPDQ